jgi:hypothetical protein
MVEGNLILDRTLLEDLQFKAPLISEDEPIITYPNASDISPLPTREELLQLTTPAIGSENKIEDPTPFPFSIEEYCFDDDIGNSLKAHAYDLKGLKFEPARQDLEEFMLPRRTSSNCSLLSAEIGQQLLRKMVVISGFILIPKQSIIACKVFRSERFAMIQERD